MSANATPADVLAGRAQWALVESDCLGPQGMACLPDGCVDHFITDPPYSDGLYSRTRTNKGTGIRANGRPYARTELQPQTGALQLASKRIGGVDGILVASAGEAVRLTRRWIVVFSDIEITPRWRESLGASYLRTGIWLKPDAMPQVTGDRPGQAFEALTIAHGGGRRRWNAGGKLGVWIFGTCKGDERPDHPCPKPLELMLQLVRDFTLPGELICDPFAGSGTTGVAAIMLGRRFIGWERDAKYAAVARKRLAATREQLGLPLVTRRRSGLAKAQADMFAPDKGRAA